MFGNRDQVGLAALSGSDWTCASCLSTSYSPTGACLDCAAPNVVDPSHRTCTACLGGEEPNQNRTEVSSKPRLQPLPRKLIPTLSHRVCVVPEL